MRIGGAGVEKTRLGMKDRKSTGAKPAQLSPEIQAKIGQQLRKLYDDMVSQGVPDRFAELINRLEKQDDSEKR